MFCQKCGTENTDTTKFCVKCGTGLSVPPTQTASRPPTSRPEAANVARTAASEPSPAAVPLVILSYVFAAIALLVVPVVFGTIGIGLAITSYYMGNRKGGRTAIWVCSVCTLVWPVIGGIRGGLGH